MTSPAKRRIVLKDGDGRVYDVQVMQDAVGFDLRRKARPKLADDDLRLVKLRKADNTDLELDKVVPPGVGSDIASAVMVEVEGLVETQQVEPPKDELCKWLEEAVAMEPKPSTWGRTEDTKELTFTNKILGNKGMGNDLVVRECYVQMNDEAMQWLNKKTEDDKIGLFIVTGTPGIGKSMFLGFMLAFLAEEQKYHIVVQRGNMWWSRQIGRKTMAHYETKPIKLLQSSQTLLLADPHGGDGRAQIEQRSAGCTMVFTSPSKKSYDTPYKQQKVESTLRYMPVWALEEYLTHREKLFPHVSHEQVKQAHSLLGGSLRWLRELLSTKGDMSNVARDLVQQSIHNCTYDNLHQAVKSVPSDMQVGESLMSLLLQIHSVSPFHKPTTKLIESSVVSEAIREKLDAQSREARPRFINACLDLPALGTFVGDLLQDEVYQKLTQCDTNYILKLKSLSDLKTCELQVPCLVRTLHRKEGKLISKQRLQVGCLYCPKSKIFPATDIFFVMDHNGSFALCLLQITKRDTHDCKVEKMKDQFVDYFDQETVDKVDLIKWIVVTPTSIAKKYTTVQSVKGSWQKTATMAVKVEQYVSAWKV
ncbi:Crinkler effector protein 15 [Durusdinium trenchii]|uniref:Crinkler effector protein 15 n=1 Tax=Durusdinium trenchii TaxID=1381693 RepID=A0ABP0ID26_9DINO